MLLDRVPFSVFYAARYLPAAFAYADRCLRVIYSLRTIAASISSIVLLIGARRGFGSGGHHLRGRQIEIHYLDVLFV